MSRQFFYVFRDAQRSGGLHFAIYHDDPPTKAMLRQTFGGNVVWRQELDPTVQGQPLEHYAACYRSAVAEGTLPPDNMTTPPAPKRDERIYHGFPPLPWCVGDIERERKKAT